MLFTILNTLATLQCVVSTAICCDPERYTREISQAYIVLAQCPFSIVDKFLKRIVSVDMDDSEHDAKHHEVIAAQVHAYTHGINSDPLALLAIMFSGKTSAATIDQLELFRDESV
jgi:hypothetical protein